MIDVPETLEYEHEVYRKGMLSVEDIAWTTSYIQGFPDLSISEKP